MLRVIALIFLFIPMYPGFAKGFSDICKPTEERLECLERLKKEFSNEKQDKFLKDFLITQLNLESCRTSFNPDKAISQWVSKGDMLGGSIELLKVKKWEEKDTREPGLLNHMMEWNYPGHYLRVVKNFSNTGPSTWLDRYEITDTNTSLPLELKIGMSFDKFSDKLNFDKENIKSFGFSSQSGYVTLKVNAKNNVQAIQVECIAD